MVSIRLAGESVSAQEHLLGYGRNTYRRYGRGFEGRWRQGSGAKTCLVGGGALTHPIERPHIFPPTSRAGLRRLLLSPGQRTTSPFLTLQATVERTVSSPSRLASNSAVRPPPGAAPEIGGVEGLSGPSPGAAFSMAFKDRRRCR
jgi:hypothetical protein